MARRYQNFREEFDALPLRIGAGVGVLLLSPAVIARVVAGTSVGMLVAIPLLATMAGMVVWLLWELPPASDAGRLALIPGDDGPAPAFSIPVAIVGPEVTAGEPRRHLRTVRREITTGQDQLPE
jgi:hypothetical protein